MYLGFVISLSIISFSSLRFDFNSADQKSAEPCIRGYWIQGLPKQMLGLTDIRERSSSRVIERHLMLSLIVALEPLQIRGRVPACVLIAIPALHKAPKLFEITPTADTAAGS
jgi:hypothetical protein